jgi:hypothetical protein
MNEKEAAILKLLKQYGSQFSKIYIEPDIPEKKLNNATKSCQVPEGEEILALFDFTEWGSAKDCMLICKNTIYFHFITAQKISLTDFVELPVKSSLSGFKIGDAINVALNSNDLPATTAAQCLSDIQLIMKKGPDIDLYKDEDRPLHVSYGAMLATFIVGLTFLVAGSFILTMSDDFLDAIMILGLLMIAPGVYMVANNIIALLRIQKHKGPVS